MKSIKRSTLRELARIVRGYARTGDVELLFAKNETARKLATQAYGKNDAWSAFADFVYSVVGVYALYPECTDEEFEELFKWLGFEIEEGEYG